MSVLTERLERLRAARWGSAPAWEPRVRELVLRYYERMLPFWPPELAKVLPHNIEMIESLRERLSKEERSRVEAEKENVIACASDRSLRIGREMTWLITAVLASSVLVDRGELSVDDDPAVPLLDFIEAGFDLAPTHGGIEVLHERGMTTMLLPTRAEVELRRAARGSR